jgi:hypothetical protein
MLHAAMRAQLKWQGVVRMGDLLDNLLLLVMVRVGLRQI